MSGNNENPKKVSKQRSTHRVIGKALLLLGFSVSLFTFIIAMYISLAAYTGQSTQITDYRSLLSPLTLTGVVMMVFGLAALLYPSGLSKDGSWVLMTGPYVR